MTAPTPRRETADLIQELTAASMSLASPLGWRRALDASVRLSDLTASSVLLVGRQRPDVTMVASAVVWGRRGRHVLSGEPGIKILVAPERQGGIPRETALLSAPMPRKARAGLVYDVTQTRPERLGSAAPRPPSQLLAGDLDRIVVGLRSQAASFGYDVLEHGTTTASTSVIDHSAREVSLRKGLTGPDAAAALLRTLAQIRLHRPESLTRDDVAEVEAASVAYVVGRRSGLDLELAPVHAHAGWASGSHTALLTSLHRVVATAQSIAHRLDPAAVATTRGAERAHRSLGMSPSMPTRFLGR